MNDPKNNRSRRGTATVEAALVLPLLLILTFGGIKYGWLFIKWQQATNAARHSVRYAIRPTIDSTKTIDLIDKLMTKAGMDKSKVNYTSLVTYGDDDYPTGSIVGDPVTVQIVVPVADVDILKIALLPTPNTLTATMTMSKEGP